mmetsp:Transcript_16591/g.52926  ORF Transcript_16591/g.52926 Transcript_16591/m.52926 type:complete len:250 (+) Transcript_16591:3644-4393(+)
MTTKKAAPARDRTSSCPVPMSKNRLPAMRPTNRERMQMLICNGRLRAVIVSSRRTHSLICEPIDVLNLRWCRSSEGNSGCASISHSCSPRRSHRALVVSACTRRSTASRVDRDFGITSSASSVPSGATNGSIGCGRSRGVGNVCRPDLERCALVGDLSEARRRLMSRWRARARCEASAPPSPPPPPPPAPAPGLASPPSPRAACPSTWSSSGSSRKRRSAARGRWKRSGKSAISCRKSATLLWRGRTKP